MLTGEYDYSCTVELSEATAAKIPGVQFQAMQDIGHFPFAENPKRFAEYAAIATISDGEVPRSSS
jgi:pimeloyl-ACP methyl ester carboxylesterase